MNRRGDLYGDVIRVRFLYRLRDEKKFASLDDLRSQINKDVGRPRGISMSWRATCLINSLNFRSL